MRKVLVIQHVAIEGLGIIGPAIERAGLKADFVRIHENEALPGDTSGYSALIVLGGPMGVYEEDIYPFIGREIMLIRSALKENIPFLGICLGSQLLAKAAGASVYKGGAKEIGWHKVRLTESGSKDRLFLGLPEELTVFQWHGDTFDAPKGAQNLAYSNLFQNQLIRVGSRAYGVQFHLEVTGDMVREWIEINKEELKPLKGIDPQNIIKETPENIIDLHRYGNTVISRFLRLIDH